MSRFDQELAAAVKVGITNGSRPGDPARRDEAAVMAIRAQTNAEEAARALDAVRVLDHEPVDDGSIAALAARVVAVEAAAAVHAESVLDVTDALIVALTERVRAMEARWDRSTVDTVEDRLGDLEKLVDAISPRPVADDVGPVASPDAPLANPEHVAPGTRVTTVVGAAGGTVQIT